jgi:hypothetical protein
MDANNPKTLRILQYALHTLLSNLEEEDIEDLELEGITEDDIDDLTNWIDNKLEESKM